MINLIKFREKAEYEEGRETNLSGKEAFQIYAQSVIDCRNFESISPVTTTQPESSNAAVISSVGVLAGY